MKVLYLINHAGKAGTEKYVLNLVRAYQEKKAQCYFAYNQEGLLLEQMKEEKVPIFQFEMKHPFDIGAARKLAKYCKENEIDVIHAQYPRENYIAVLSRLFYKKPKVVFTSHLTIRTNLLWNITNRLITPFNHRIISVCNHGKDLMVGNGVLKNKIQVIFNAIPYEETDRTSTLREELGLNDEFLMVTLARYHFAKGLPFLVRSIKKLTTIAKRPFRMLIVGDGELWDEVTALIHELNLQEVILQLGFRRDVDNILNGCDLFVNSASCLEALSFAMLEALSKDLPLIATKVGGNADIVNPETDCGLIVDYPDEDAMAKAMNQMMNDSAMYERMSKNAKKAVLGRFNYDKMLEVTFETYR